MNTRCALALCTALLLTHCGDEPPEAPDRKFGGDSDATPTPETPPAAPRLEAPNPLPGGESAIDDLETLRTACGVDFEIPSAATPTAVLRGIPRTISGTIPVFGVPVPYSATIAPEATLSATPSVASVAVGAEVQNFEPALAEVPARAFANAAAWTVSADLATSDAEAFLAARSGGFQSVVCSVQPATRIIARVPGPTGGSLAEVVVRLDQPVPFGLNVVADLAQLKQEIGPGISFAAVSGIVESSAVPTVKEGTRFTISAKVAPDASTQTVVSPEGTPITVSGDAAFAISYDVSDAKIARTLSLATPRVYVLDGEAQPLKALVLKAVAGVAGGAFVRP